MYDLVTRGVQDFRLTVDRLQPVSREPLEGIVGGSNVVFRARFYPISSVPSPVVYMTSGSVSGYSIEYDTGTVIFDSPPNEQPQMSYRWSSLSDDQVVEILFSAFHHMESRWPRRWKLVDEDGDEALTPYEATAIYIVDSDGKDPQCGPRTFSESVVEREFLMACARYTYLSMRLVAVSEQAFMFREDRGITVDKGGIPQNIDLALKRADGDVKRTMMAARAVYYSSGQHLGAALKQPGTQEYFSDYEWQTAARREGRRANQ